MRMRPPWRLSLIWSRIRTGRSHISTSFPVRSSIIWRWPDGMTPQPDAALRSGGSARADPRGMVCGTKWINSRGLAWPVELIVMVKVLVEAM
jgi:hypothetical protein